MDIGGAGRGPPPGQLEPAVEVVGERGSDEREDEHDGDEAHDEVEPREGEDEEADVHVELRVLHPEVTAVAPQEVRAPSAHRPRARQQAQHDRDDEDPDASQRLDGLAILLEHLLCGRDRHVQGPGAEGDHQARRDGPTGDERSHREDHRLGGELLDEDGAETDGVEPPHVREDVRGDAPEDRQARQDEEGGAERTAPALLRLGPGGPLLTPVVTSIRTWCTVIGTHRPAEPLRTTHCSPAPVRVGTPADVDGPTYIGPSNGP